MSSRFAPLALGACLGCAPSLPPSVSSGQVPDDIARFVPETTDITTDAGPEPLRSPGLPRYDLSFVLPYHGPAQTFLLEVQPRAGRLDVLFSVDTTGSFGGEIAALKTSLHNTVIPRLRERVSNLALGVARFADFPVRPFGLPGDRPYDLLCPITTDFERATRAVFSLDRPLQNGGDLPEAWIEALYQIGTGQGLSTGMAVLEPFRPRPDLPGSGTIGGAGFREASARVVVNITDAPSHDPYSYGTLVPGTHTLEQTAEALRRLNARMIGIASGEPARAQLQTLALATGAMVPATSGRCNTGLRGASRPAINGQCPLVFDIASDGTGLGEATADAIARFLDTLAFSTVVGSVENDPHGFVQHVEALTAVAPEGAPPPRREDRRPVGMPDGIYDTFSEVSTRTRLTFRVQVRNTRAPEQEHPQLYYVRVVLLGDGLVVTERTLRIIVPEGPKPDSGRDVPRDLAVVDTANDGSPSMGPSDAATLHPEDVASHENTASSTDDASLPDDVGAR